MDSQKINVLIVEDSPTAQSLLKGILAEDPLFHVVAVVSDGKQAVDAVRRLRPDIVSMDIHMPEMNGLDATRQIMLSNPVPIVMVSSQYEPSDVALLSSILSAGALTILPRPLSLAHSQYNISARNYKNTLKMMAGIKVSSQALQVGTKKVHEAPKNVLKDLPGKNNAIKREIIAIGASAGGPLALQTILRKLSSQIQAPILIVQHIDAGFVEGFCNWLNTTSSIPVHLAHNHDQLLPGQAYLAPGDYHLGVAERGIATITKSPPEKNLRPSVGFMFRSLAMTYGKHSVGVLLSGMGTDGAMELKMLHDAGALTMAQDEASSLVHGMPGEAVRLGAADLVLSPDDIVKELMEALQ